ncbi:histidine phosphatase family protein [Bradyrhizobium sp. NP1]|uniref:histidine phosphatase family protein n=1 Tax=Bradyrhizobium sp. NP1 TaxID=3049772 RepID=UPI0025A62F76|nr:histidine phosphatase family protein [Bradyrhizobium sp. NP1]WJR78414.1 histidine phosphatase family protein [Bradyrhizobium sp. NP1]
MRALCLACAAVLLLASGVQAAGADPRELFSSLEQGGYVLVFRHVATDDSQKDVYPFRFDDMTAQRQLSDKGREMARQMGAAIKKLEIPIGEVYTSRLNRAIETGKLLSGQDVKPVDALTDSSAASTSGMANPSGANAKAGAALRQLVDTAPRPGTNTLIITHKTNMADAFGKQAGDVQEGEAFVYKSAGSGPSTFAARIKAEDWPTQAAN